MYETSFQSRFNARYWMLGTSALGRPRGMVWGGRRKEGSGWGTHVYLWQIHFDIWQILYNYVRFKNKIKLKKKKKSKSHWEQRNLQYCSDGSVGKESASNAGDLGSIPRLERFAGEGIGYPLQYSWAFPCGSAGKESACNAGDLVSIPGLGDSMEKGKTTHSSILAWRIPWTV